MIHLFTKLQFNFRDVVTNYQNISKIKTKLLIMIAQMKKKHTSKTQNVTIAKKSKNKKFSKL